MATYEERDDERADDEEPAHRLQHGEGRPITEDADGRTHQRDRFGGVNWGSAFFGWLVALALAAILVSIVGAVATGVGSATEVTQSQAEQRAGTIGIIAAVVLLVVLMVAYYAGGYVAGRMSRFDGGRQGVAVWLIGLVVTVVAAVLGVVFGTQYDILSRVDLPTIPIPTQTLTWGGAIAAVVVLVGTVLAAVAGGKVGQRYHRRVDEAAFAPFT